MAVLTYWVGWDSSVKWRSKAQDKYVFVAAVALPPSEGGGDAGFVGAGVMQAWLGSKRLEGVVPLGLPETVGRGGAEWALIGVGENLETITVCGMAPGDVALEVEGDLFDALRVEFEATLAVPWVSSTRFNLGMVGGDLCGVAVSSSGSRARGLRVYGADGSRWISSEAEVHSAHLWVAAPGQAPALLFLETLTQAGPRNIGSLVSSEGRLDFSMEMVGYALDDGAGQSLAARFDEDSAALRIALGGHGVFGADGGTDEDGSQRILRTPWVGAAVLRLLEDGWDLMNVPICWITQ